MVCEGSPRKNVGKEEEGWLMSLVENICICGTVSFMDHHHVGIIMIILSGNMLLHVNGAQEKDIEHNRG